MTELEMNIEIAWKEYSDSLLAFILTKVDSYEDAQDILAVVFLKLAKQSESSNFPGKLPNWLYRVTKNAIIDYYRTKQPLVVLPKEMSDFPPYSDVVSELSTCLAPLVSELPETYKQTIILAEIEGKSHKQVAEELGISLSSVKSRVLRGRKRLKAIMARRCTFSYNANGELVEYQEKEM